MLQVEHSAANISRDYQSTLFLDWHWFSLKINLIARQGDLYLTWGESPSAVAAKIAHVRELAATVAEPCASEFACMS